MPGSPRRREVFSGVLGWQEIGLDGGLCEGRKRLAKSTDTPLFMNCIVFPSHSCVEVLVAGPLERSWIWREVIKVKQSHLSGSCSNATRVLVRRGPETRLCEGTAGRQLSASQRDRGTRTCLHRSPGHPLLRDFEKTHLSRVCHSGAVLFGYGGPSGSL